MKVSTDNKSLLWVYRNLITVTKIFNDYIASEKEQLLLGKKIDSILTFVNRLQNVGQKVNEILNALARIGPYIISRIE